MVIQQPAPTIERHKKPSRVPSNGYHTYNSHRSSSQLQYPNESTLDKRNHMRDMKMVSIWLKISNSFVLIAKANIFIPNPKNNCCFQKVWLANHIRELFVLPGGDTGILLLVIPGLNTFVDSGSRSGYPQLQFLNLPSCRHCTCSRTLQESKLLLSWGEPCDTVHCAVFLLDTVISILSHPEKHVWNQHQNQFNLILHGHGPFYLLILFGLDFDNWIFVKTFRTFLEVSMGLFSIPDQLIKSCKNCP